MSCQWFLEFFVNCLISLNFVFGLLIMTYILGVSVLWLWMLWRVSSLPFVFIFLCIVVFVSLFANGALVMWWLLCVMMFLWSTLRFSLLCPFVVCPGLFWGVPTTQLWMSWWTGGLFIHLKHKTFPRSKELNLVVYSIHHVFPVQVCTCTVT